MNDGVDFEFDKLNLPIPNIDELPQRGNYRLLRCGVKGSVPIGRPETEQLRAAKNYGEYVNISHKLIAESPVFVVQRSPQSAEIAQYLEKIGVPVERLRKQFETVDAPLEDGEYFSERLGQQNLQQALRQATGSKRTAILRNYAHTLSSIHLSNVLYGGNHAGNMICASDNTVFFIDFTSAHQERIDWQNMAKSTCLLTFVPELKVLIVQNLTVAGCSDDETKYTLDQVLSEYPMSSELKQLIRQRIIGES